MKKTRIYAPIQPEILELSRAHGDDPAAVLEIFWELQDRHGFLSREHIEDTARALKIPAEQAQGMATFYTMLATAPSKERVIRICDGPVCWLHGANSLLENALEYFGEGWSIERTSCLGLCDRAPAAWVNGDQVGPISFVPAKDPHSPHDGLPSLDDILESSPPHPSYDSPREGEVRVMLADIAEIDPNDIDSSIQAGAYAGLRAALNMKREEIIEEVKQAGIRGRGGAGFPVGLKWGFVAKETRTPKFVVANADESEPLVFKDRVLIENKPHQLIEGMAICAFAVGASEGYIYIRGEYESQARLLKHAIRQAEAHGFLGENIFGTDFCFRVHLHHGAGAYICGEETALLESLEGRRGEPRIRPPYPTVSGYRGLPTVVNNVESFCSIPHILVNGSDWYHGLSSSRTAGTKIFMISGHVKNPGLFEAPFGLTLREMIERFAGGMRDGSKFHFALCGGAAGTLIPEGLLDVPLDYDSHKHGISLGAGAFLVCDQGVSPVEILRELLHFFENESCGKCTPCRIGTHQTRLLLDRILAGDRRPGDVERLKALGELMGNSSFCGLGVSTNIPISSALAHFEEYFG